MTRMSNGGRFAWGLVVLLVILHYDFWYWNDQTIVLGFLPVGLFFQVVSSIAAAVAWLLVVKFAWPSHLEEWAGQATEGRMADGAGDDSSDAERRSTNHS